MSMIPSLPVPMQIEQVEHLLKLQKWAQKSRPSLIWMN